MGRKPLEGEYEKNSYIDTCAYALPVALCMRRQKQRKRFVRTTPDSAQTTPAPDSADSSDTQSTDDSNAAGNEEMTVNEALSGVIDMIYEKSPVEFAISENMPVDLTNSDSVKAYTGLADGSRLDGAVFSEPMIMSQAYSLIMVRVKDDADAEAVKKDMIDGIDPRKWICVTADEVRAINSGKVVMLIMVSSQLEEGKADAICDAFVEIFGSENCGERLSRTVLD